MIDEKQARSLPLMKLMYPSIKLTGYDDFFIQACKGHVRRVIANQFCASNLSDEDYISTILSNFFLYNVDQFRVTKRFSYQNPGCWPIELVPSEVFSDIDMTDYRKRTFYFCLKVGDYLECRVISNLPNEYELRVINKPGSIRMLDDLDIRVVLPKTELPLHQNEFASGQLIRVLVSKKDKVKDEIKVIVTLNYSRTEHRQLRFPLGPMPEEQLPIFILHPRKSEGISTFKDYLNSKLGFHNTLLVNDIYKNFGLDPKGYYSFFPYNESLNFIDASNLLREAKAIDADYLARKAIHDLERKNFEEALKSVETAIKMFSIEENQSDKIQLCKLREIRGKIHKEEEKPRRSQGHLVNWEKAWKLDKSNLSLNAELSKIMSNVANYHYKKKKYSKAAEVAKRALILDKNNADAQVLTDYLKKKHTEAFVNLDEESLLTLHEKKKELVNQLKKLN